MKHEAWVRSITSAVCVAMCAVPPVYAEIRIEGTSEENDAILEMIDCLREESEIAKALLDALMADETIFTIRIGETLDIATATPKTNTVVLFMERINALEQRGEGQGLEAMSPKLALAHELLGHLWNRDQGNSWGETAAMDTTNLIRVELGLPKRMRYGITHEINGVYRHFIPFADGSFVETTDALKIPRTSQTGDRKRFVPMSVDAHFPVIGQPDPVTGGMMIVPVDPAQAQLQLGPSELGDPTQLVSLVDFQMLVHNSIEPDFPAEIELLQMQLGSMVFNGQPIDPSAIDMIDEGRGGAGQFLFEDASMPLFIADLASDQRWLSPQFDAIGLDGYLVQSVLLDMNSVEPLTGASLGVVTLTGLLYGPGDSMGCNEADIADPFGILDFSDVIAFLLAFGSGDPVADLAPPQGVFDFSDVVAFLSAYGVGCP